MVRNDPMHGKHLIAVLSHGECLKLFENIKTTPNLNSRARIHRQCERECITLLISWEKYGLKARMMAVRLHLSTEERTL